MVQKHLREMGKNAKIKEAEEGHQRATLIAMEAAALLSMKRDGQEVPSTGNQDFVILTHVVFSWPASQNRFQTSTFSSRPEARGERPQTKGLNFAHSY